MGLVIQEGLEVDSLSIPERSKNIVRLGPLNVPEELSEIINRISEEEYRSVLGVTRMLIEYGIKYLEEPNTPKIELPIRSGGIVRIGPLQSPSELKDIMEQMATDEDCSISGVARLLIEYGLKYLERVRKD